MRPAGNFHPEWGYLAPAPSFLRTLRVALVATAIGATAGAAVVISLVERPTAADSSIAAHALVTAPVTVAENKVAKTKRAVAPIDKPIVAQTPLNNVPAAKSATAAATVPSPPQTASLSTPAGPALNGSANTLAAVARKPVPMPKPAPQAAPSVATLTVPEAMTEPPPASMHDATAIAPEVAPAKKIVRRRFVRNEPVRRWRSEAEARNEARRRWRRDGGFGPLFHLFSFRTGSLFDSN